MMPRAANTHMSNSSAALLERRFYFVVILYQHGNYMLYWKTDVSMNGPDSRQYKKIYTYSSLVLYIQYKTFALKYRTSSMSMTMYSTVHRLTGVTLANII